MEKVLNVAFYIFNQYLKKMHDEIDQMKLHKLLYFSQRESLVQTEQPLFEEEFQGWKYGPVCVSVRNAYVQGQFKNEENFKDVEQNCKDIVNKVLEQYGSKNSWSLSDITHFEYSWIQSRIGIKDGVNGDNPMRLEDIRVDAERIRERRKALSQKKSKKSTNVHPVPIVADIDLEEPKEFVDVAAEIKKIQKDLKRRNKNR